MYKLEEKQAVSELSKNYDEFIAYALLVATSTMLLSKKKKLINKKFKTIARRNGDIITKSQYNLYKNGKDNIYKALGKKSKRLTAPQKKELEIITEQAQQKAIGMLNGYKVKADTLIVSEALKQYRETGLGVDNAQERFAYGKKLKKKLAFQNSKGQRIKTKGLTRVIIGDSLYSGYVAGQRSTLLNLDILKVIHVSVMDNRTTEICASLDGQIRNILTDQLPPMHVGCRSIIVPYKENINKK